MLRGLAFVFTIALFGCPGDGAQPVCDPDTSKECHEGYKCDRVTKFCLRQCDDDGDCLAVQACDLSAGQPGVCRQSVQQPGDPSGGDPAGGDSAPVD
jgi:hypothetical protein